MEHVGAGDCYGLYRRYIPRSFFEDLPDGEGRRGIFTVWMVAWLMIYQRLCKGASCREAVLKVTLGEWKELNGASSRVKKAKVSEATGGYSQARDKFSVKTAEKICDRLFALISKNSRWEKLGRPVFGVDGTTIELCSDSRVVKRYPHSNSKRGILHTLVLHDLLSGCAARPSYGAFYGKELVTEGDLCKDAVSRIPKNAIVVGDRNFGIFDTSYAIVNSGRELIVRLTEDRAKRILGAPPKPGTDTAVIWSPSAYERRRHLDLPADADIRGRVLCERIKSREGNSVLLIVFTTLAAKSCDVLECYELRWWLETDLRTLKRTVNMYVLSGKTPEMVQKELLLGIAAYNLVRSLMSHGAAASGLNPRQMSFTQTLSIVFHAMPKLSSAATKEERLNLLHKILHLSKRATLPKRKKRNKVGNFDKEKTK